MLPSERLRAARTWLARGGVAGEAGLLAELASAAEAVCARAHAPYSGLHVGAALLGDDGQVYAGCNVENASYGLTMCAERAAAFAGVAAGAGSFLVGYLCVPGSAPVLPCGACRQVLHEFAPELLLVCTVVGSAANAEQAGSQRIVRSLSALLPDPMGASDLPRP